MVNPSVENWGHLKQSTCIMSVQYTGGCSVHRGYHWVHRGISWVHHDECGNIMSTVGGCSVHRGIPWVHWGIPWWVRRDIMSTRGMFSTLGFRYKVSCFPNDLPPRLSWYPSGVLMISPRVLNTPSVLMISPGVLNTPSVLMIFPRCTEHPSLYCTPPVCYTDIYVGWQFELFYYPK